MKESNKKRNSFKNEIGSIEESFTLPGNFYTSESIFNDSIDRLFINSWQFVTDDSVIKQRNSVYPFVLMDCFLNEPLLLVNNQKDVKCYSNVCTHRGNLLVDNPCVLNHSIICSYHGRRFDLCGKFIFMPETDNMKNFPTKKDDLPLVHCSKWRHFIFTSIKPRFSLEVLFKDIEERIGWMPIEEFKYREDLSKDYLIDANWALYCDNYLEGFHIPFIHKDLNNQLDYSNYSIETFTYSSLQIGYGMDDASCFDLPDSSIDYGKNIAAYYFWLFPNIMLNFYPWGLSINLVIPLSVNKTRVEFKSYVWKDSLLSIGAGSDLDKVELEDQIVVQKVQKGISSRLYDRGRFSPSMEKGVHHFHKLIQKFIEL